MYVKRYWAYKHINGHIKVKSYFGKRTSAAIYDARDSEFVDRIMYPYSAHNREDAETKAKLFFAKRA
jgi:hypothetical protein